MPFGKNRYGGYQNRSSKNAKRGEEQEGSREEAAEEKLANLHDFPDDEPQEVTLVELLRRPRSCYRIYFGPHYVTVHESTMIRYGMTKGSFFNKEAVFEIVRDNERQIAYTQALNYLSFQARTSGEIEKKLLEKDIDPEAAAETVRRLEEEKLGEAACNGSQKRQGIGEAGAAAKRY